MEVLYAKLENTKDGPQFGGICSIWNIFNFLCFALSYIDGDRVDYAILEFREKFQSGDRKV